jgi:hypothetical protein
MRTRFQGLFLSFLEKQLILKKIINSNDWKFLKEELKFSFTVDNYFAELKQTQIMKERLNLASIAEVYIGKYYDENYIRKTILKQTNEEISQMDANAEVDKQKEDARQFHQAERDITIGEMQAQSQMKIQLQQAQMSPDPEAATSAPKPKSNNTK